MKDSEMEKNDSHLTFHAYLDQKSNTPDLLNMWKVDAVLPKRDANQKLKIEKDEYFDKRKNKKVNNWKSRRLHPESDVVSHLTWIQILTMVLQRLRNWQARKGYNVRRLL